MNPEEKRKLQEDLIKSFISEDISILRCFYPDSPDKEIKEIIDYSKLT